MSWMLGSRLEGYERLLATQPYLAGSQLTLADLFHVAHGRQILEVRVSALFSAALTAIVPLTRGLEITTADDR
jgi:glutathione S-transferase